ncbi:arginine--tRNA ligase [Patescibacteria group bacterium]|nr:arginine--tRNA ligase [Patescibacteria group bacterium]
MFYEFKNQIFKTLSDVKIFGVLLSDLEKFDISIIEEPKDQEKGDFSLPCFLFSKELGKKPSEIADEIFMELRSVKNDVFCFERVNAYVNFFINNEFIFDRINYFFKKSCPSPVLSKKEKILLEYSSPNANKAQHLGHLRNNVLGISMKNILSYVGYSVSTCMIVNDKGTAISKALYMYMNLDREYNPEIDGRSDDFVGALYSSYSKLEKENPKVKEEIQEINRKWENGDLEIRKKWKEMCDLVYQGYDNLYNRLGCTFDKRYYESDIYEKGKDIVLKGLEDGIFQKSEGAVVSDLSSFNIPDTVLLKSDGTTLYITQDLYLSKIKKKDFHPKKSIYIVANEQNLHFKQLFKILEQLGYYKNQDTLHHLSYGYVYLPDGKMKSREGNVIQSMDLIDEVSDLIYKNLKNREDENENLKEKAESLAISTIKFQFLKINSKKDMIFDPKKSVSINGETSLYIQYTYSRINSLLKKANFSDFNIKSVSINADIERDLLRRVLKFNNTISSSVLSYDPSIICKYLIDISKVYNDYYQNNKILGSKNEESSLNISYFVSTIIKKGLEILDIKVFNRM